jgi:predicted TIM-barrel fold metal-dependent hydrolase
MAIPIIDSDTHVTEPADLWTSRIASKWGDLVPHVKWDTELEAEAWFIGDQNLGAAAGSASYGWKELWPSVPPTYAEAHPASYDATERLKVMDASGIYAEVLYPNVGGFGSTVFLKAKDPKLVLECVRAYNDFLIDWIQPAPERFVPVAALPFWDVQASVKEIERAVSARRTSTACPTSRITIGIRSGQQPKQPASRSVCMSGAAT